MDAVSGGSSSESPSSGSGSGGPSRNELDILKDAEESQHYPPDTFENVRVRNLNPRGSTVNITTNQYHRTRDAELKALRHIELDIRQKTIPEGGRITAYVSQPPCDSCANAIRNFGQQYRVSGNVYHLVPPAKNGSPVSPEIAESNRAAKNYFNARVNAIRKGLKTGNVKAPASPAWDADSARTINALRATEQGLLSQTCRS